MSNTIFMNIDTQKDFMLPDGNLYVQGAETIFENLKAITILGENDPRILIINTADWHTPESAEFSDTPDFNTTFPPHCIKETDGANFIDQTCPNDDKHSYPEYIVSYDQGFTHPKEGLVDLKALKGRIKHITIRKDAFNVFTDNPYTSEIITDVINPELAIVYGVTTQVCVNYAVEGLLRRGIETIVIEDAIKGLPETDGTPNSKECIKQLKEKGVKTIPTVELINIAF